MREIKFDLIYGVPDDVSTYFRRQFTLDQMVGQEHFDEISDSPLLSNYRILHKRQFTGLADKNGVEIYEGDILSAFHYEYDEFQILPVAYENCCFSLGRYWKDGIHDWNSMEQYDSSDLEVIGNIHQHPELLEAAK